MQLTDKDGNVYGWNGLEITTSSGKPKIPVINTDITIGTTAIIGGVSGRVLYNNAGVVGETNGINWNPTSSTLSLLDSTFYSQAGNSSANTDFSITGTASSNYTIYSSRQFIFNTGQSMYFNTDIDGGSALDRAWYFAGARSGITGGRTYGALTVDSSGFPSFTLYNNDNGARILLASNTTSYFNGGNLLVGTTTDAGFKLDVNGTQRVQVSSAGIPNILSISNLQTDAGPGGAIAFYTGGVVGNASRIVAQRSGSVGQSDIALETNGVRRLFVSANDGNVGIGTTTLGTTTQLTIGGAQTASSAIARGILLNTSLTQSIANDVLTAVQITPTLSVNNTLFHEAYWLRLTGSYIPASYTSNNNATTIDLSNSFTNTFNAIGIRIRHTYGNVQNGYGILLESAGFVGIAQTSSTSNNFFAGTTIIGNSVIAPASGYTLHVTNNTNGAIKIGSVSQGSEHLIISHSQAGATFSSIRSTFINTGAQMQISVGGQDNLRLFGTGNVTVGGTTDAGFKLDVNGTVRSQGNLFFGTAGSYLLGDTNNIRLIDKNGQIILQSFPTGVNNSETYLRCANSIISFLRLRDDYMSLEWANSNISSTAQNPIQITRGYFGNVGATDKSVLYVKSTAFSNLNNATTLRGIFIDINDTTTFTGFTTARAIEAPRGGAYFNTTLPQSSAILQADSTTQGFLPPRQTQAQRTAIASPAVGLIVYQTDLIEGLYIYKSTGWTFIV